MFRAAATALIAVAALVLTVHASTVYDDDAQIEFVWDAPSDPTPFSFYRVMVSVDDGAYNLAGTVYDESYTVDLSNGHSCRIKVSAVSSSDIEGPFSDESDLVICDTVRPTKPVINSNYQRLDLYRVRVDLSKVSVDDNLECYQFKGGNFSQWTDSSIAQSFIFTIDPGR